MGLTAELPSLILLNAARTPAAQNARMMIDPSNIAVRLLAHARLCREVARESRCDEMAETLDRLAEDCVQAARAADFFVPKWNSAIRPST